MDVIFYKLWGGWGAERWADMSKSGQQAQYLSTFVSSAACESLLGTSRKIPPCVEVEKKMWLWKYPNSKHSPSHMQLYLRQADVSSAAPPPPEMTAALMSGAPSHGGVSRDWWGSSVSRPRTGSRLLPAQTTRARQADRQAGPAIHAKILKYMAGKLPPSRGQMGWTCGLNCSGRRKRAAGVIGCSSRVEMDALTTWSVKDGGLI